MYAEPFFRSLFRSEGCSRFDLFGVVLEDMPQKPNAAVENFFGRPPIRFGCSQMNGKLPSELQRIPVQRLILLFEAHVFKALGSVLVPC